MVTSTVQYQDQPQYSEEVIVHSDVVPRNSTLVTTYVEGEEPLPRGSRVISRRTIGERVIEERRGAERELNVTLNPLPEVLLNELIPRTRKSTRIDNQPFIIEEEEPIIVEKIVEKEIEVLVKRKVTNLVEIDLFYEL